MRKIKIQNKYYTAMNEAVFYYCIGNNLDVVKVLIEQVLKTEIISIESKNTKLLKDYMNTKEKTLDYLVLTDKGYINIEINNSNETWRINRNISYACKVLTNSIGKEENYNEMAPIIQINLNRLGKTKCPYALYKLKTEIEDKKYPKTLSEILGIYVLNIDFYKNEVYNGNKKFINNNYLLCALDLQPEDLDNISEGNEELMEFKKKLEEINNNEDFVNWISAEEEDAKIRRTKELIFKEKVQKAEEKVQKAEEKVQKAEEKVKHAEKKVQQTEEKLEQTEEKLEQTEEKLEQIMKNIEQSIENEKKNKAIEVAMNLLNLNIDKNKIIEATGLSIDDIENLIK